MLLVGSFTVAKQFIKFCWLVCDFDAVRFEDFSTVLRCIFDVSYSYMAVGFLGLP